MKTNFLTTNSEYSPAYQLGFNSCNAGFGELLQSKYKSAEEQAEYCRGYEDARKRIAYVSGAESK